MVTGITVGIKVGLLGMGTVGTGTVEILLNPKDRHPLMKELELSRVGVRSMAKPRQFQLPEERLTTDLAAIVNDPSIHIIVEVIGGIEPARSLILQAIANGKHIVTANKALIARHGSEIFDAANRAGVYVLLEAAVGGGIPVVEPLKQSLCANRIMSLIGIINGTTNYILTRMQQEGGDFAHILQDAQRLGYAEADPSADVNGWDAADKISILAALAFGGRIKREEVYCEGIGQITAADISYSDKLGFVIKLLAIARRWGDGEGDQPQLQVQVHPTLVPKSHPLSSVNDVYNAILVEGDPVGEVMFFGRGAGAGPTASAVVADILNIAALLTVERGHQRQSSGYPVLDPLLACTHQEYYALIPITHTKSRFYARFLTHDHPGVIGKLGTCFGNRNVSLESVVQIGLREQCAEIVVVTHGVNEYDFRAALTEIETLNAIHSIPSVLRVL
jgi:homoserine dehydrogenase